jgi:hypothetical protein
MCAYYKAIKIGEYIVIERKSPVGCPCTDPGILLARMSNRTGKLG